MNPLLPAVSASTFMLAAVSGLYFHLYTQYRDPYLRSWAFSWSIYALRNGLQLAMLFGFRGAGPTFAYQAAAIWSGYLLLLGTYQFLARSGCRKWFLVSVGASAWLAISLVFHFSFVTTNLPLFTFLGAVHVWTGWALVSERAGRTRGGILAAGAFVLLGAHRTSYPFLRPVEWYAPWGYQLGSELVLLVAIGVIVVFFEHTRTRIERSERRFKGLIDGAGDAIFLCDPVHRRIVEVNRAACAALGRPREDLVGRDLREAGLDLPASAGEDPTALSDAIPAETTLPGPHGGRVPVEIRYTALETDAQGIVLAVARDVSARKKAEEALRESEEKFRAVFDWVNDAIFVHDAATGRILDVNARMLERYGCTREEALAASLDDFSSGEPGFDSATAFELMRRAAAGERLVFEWHAKAKDGHLFWVEVNISRARIRGEDRLVAAARDITERRRAEEERSRLEAQVRHAQKLESLGILAGGIAHDFNNLLTGVLGYAELALAEMSPLSPVKESVEKIRSSALRAADLTRQLLAYSGKGRFVVEPVSVTELVREMVHLLEISISKKCVLRFDLAADLPRVEADAGQLRQIVMNLVINASESIGDRSGVIAVSTGASWCTRRDLADGALGEDRPEGLYVHLEVADTGCGMDRETLERIFDPFFTTKFTGRGLGLAAVLGIVRGHHGSLQVESEPGRGTRFRILLPAAETEKAPSLEAEECTGEWRGHGIVLVVDDEETVRALAQQMLRAVGFAALTAGDGREALTILQAHAGEVRAVLLDMTMPHMDGAETFRRLREIRGELPVVLTSGYSEQDALGRCEGLAFAGFLQKPFRMAEFTTALRRALGE